MAGEKPPHVGPSTAQMDKAIEALTIRVVQARNGYIVKTTLGQFVYANLDEALVGIKAHYEPNKEKKS